MITIVILRSEQYCVLENAHREFTFVNEFFILTGAEGNEVFTQVMGKALGVVAVSSSPGNGNPSLNRTAVKIMPTMPLNHWPLFWLNIYHGFLAHLYHAGLHFSG